MRNLKSIINLLIILSSLLIAQEKLLTVEDVVLNPYSKLAPANLKQLSWLPSTNSYVYIDGIADNSSILKFEVNANTPDTLITLKELNGHLEKLNIKKLINFPQINWQNSTSFNFWSDKDLFLFDLKNKSLKKINSIEEETDNQTIAPNQKYIAFTKSNNLFVSLDDSKIVQISNDKDTNIVNGQSVHRNEFGINRGIFWSPKCNYIAYYRMDQSMVTDYPLVDVNFTPARLKNIKYPMAGQTSHQVTVGIYETKSGKTIWLKTGEPLEQYLTCLTWSPDEKHFYIAHLNRDQNHMQLKKYDVATGDFVKILFEESDSEYVEPENPLIFLPDSNDKFLWFSERDGYDHLYLFDTNGNLIRQVTQGNWVVTSFNGFDKTNKHIFISGTKDSPLERHFYQVNLENGEMKRITKEKGTHTMYVSPNYNYYIDSFNNTTTPRQINLLNNNFDVVKNLFSADNPLKDYKIGNSKIFSLKNDESIDLYCRMVFPPDFDQTIKYPVIVYVYGGSHDQEVTNSFGFGRYFLWFYMMAQKGYILFTLDNRGSANRGLDFEQATFRRLGTLEIKDQMTGVNYLKSLPYIDPNRIGVYGWSYGGFMTTSLMLRTNGAFKVGACGGAVIDWKFYEVMYTERYMDTPQTNPEGYKEASLLNYVENLNSKLLLVHGTSDPFVVWQNTLSFVKKAIEMDKPLDYFPYIGHEHGVRGKDALHLYYKITNYFLDNL